MADAQAADKPMVVITGKGLFTGELTKTFEITTKDIGKASMTANNVTFRNKTGFCFVEPVLKDVSGRKLVAGTDYTDLTYTYVAETPLYDGSIKLAGSVVGKDDIPVANDNAEPYIKVTAKGTGNYTGEISCTYQILKDKTILEQIFPQEPANNMPSANINQNVVQNPTVEEAEESTESSTEQLAAGDKTNQSEVADIISNSDELPQKDAVADKTTVFEQIQEEKQEVLKDTVLAMSDSTSDLEKNEDSIDSVSVEEMQQLTEGNADDIKVDSVSKKSQGMAAAAVVVCLAAISGVAGIRFFKKKKAENYFFDEEDDFLD